MFLKLVTLKENKSADIAMARLGAGDGGSNGKVSNN